MLKELDDYDWREVFGYASPSSIPLSENPASTESFEREDVTEIVAMSEGENDEEDWLICGKLKDGRYFSIEAGCDYTGWDCQASGFATVAMDLYELIILGMSPQARGRLGLEVSGQ